MMKSKKNSSAAPPKRAGHKSPGIKPLVAATLVVMILVALVSVTSAQEQWEVIVV